jgi:hypothetical protein
VKILIGNFVLADSPDPIPLTNLRITGSGNVQPVQFFRATAMQFYDRGNQKTEISFDTTQLWPNQLAAESYILMLRTMFPTTGLVTFVAGVKGTQTASRYLLNAVVQNLQSSMMGACTTKHSFRISGGIMQTTPT